MGTVYIVTEEEYGDSRIVMAFSTREMADKYVAEYNRWAGSVWKRAEVEERDLDVPPSMWDF